jgi:hypothetical protein
MGLGNARDWPQPDVGWIEIPQCSGRLLPLADRNELILIKAQAVRPRNLPQAFP